MSEPADAHRHRPTGWIVATVVLLLAVIGLGAWALSLRSDNQDKDATIASQQQQLAEQQGVAGDLREAAGNAAQDVQDALSGLGDQLDQIEGTANATQQDVQDAIAQAEDAADAARDEAESAGGEVDRLRAQAEEATAKAQEAGACARGYVSAIAGALGASSVSEGVDQARGEIESLSGSCSETLAP